MTDKSAAAIREFAEKQFPLSKELKKEVLHNQIQQAKQNECLSDLTALIEEHYYPKEFVEWMLRCSAYSDVPFREFTLKWNVNIGPDEWRCFTTDELFNYWVNNKK